MPDVWNAAIYRQRAAAWRDKATTLPEGSRERDLCQDIAHGYDDLADLIEQPGVTARFVQNRYAYTKRRKW